MIHIEIIDIQINALKYPMQDIKKLLIFGVIFIFSILILPLFLVLGYTIRVMKNTTENNDTLPEFDNIGSMFIDGVKYFIVIILYSLIPLIIIGMGLIPILRFIVTLDIDAVNVMLGVYFIFITIGTIVTIILWNIINMAVVNMAHTGKFGAAMKYIEYIDNILTPLIIIGTGLIPILGFIVMPDLFVIIAVFGGLILIIIGIIVAICLYMIMHMAVVNMAHTGEFGVAFIIVGKIIQLKSEIIQRTKNIGIGTYILWFITLFIITMIISVLYGIIMIIPLLGIILAVLIGYPYLLLFISRSMALIYMKGS